MSRDGNHVVSISPNGLEPTGLPLTEIVEWLLTTSDLKRAFQSVLGRAGITRPGSLFSRQQKNPF